LRIHHPALTDDHVFFLLAISFLRFSRLQACFADEAFTASEVGVYDTWNAFFTKSLNGSHGLSGRCFVKGILSLSICDVFP